MKRDPLPAIPPSVALPLTKSSGWRIALPALAVTLACITVAYLDTAAGMVRIWAHSETFAHGFAVAPISLWLIWRMRARLRSIEPQPSWVVLPLIAAAGFGWLVGNAGTVNVVSQFAFVSLLVLAVPAILGTRLTRAMLFPLGFLFFSVPLGEFLLPTLMSHTANFTIAALRASGVPVYREGLQFVIPNGRWSIVEACSGVRYLIASLVVGSLFAYLNYRSMWRRLAFVGVSIVVPIVANWIRAYIIVMLGYLSGNKIATGVDHIIYGWLFFGFVMFIMFAIGARWREPVRASDARPATAHAGPSVSASAPRLWTAAAGVAAMTLVWPLADGALQSHSSDTSATLATIRVAGWQATPAADDFTPHFEAPSAVRHERFQRGDRVVGLYVAYYRGQNANHKLVSSDNVLLRTNDKFWHAVSGGSPVMAIGGKAVPVVSARIRGADGRTIEARRWYWIDGVLTSSDPMAKARVAWLRVTGRGDDSAVIVVYTPADASADPDETLRQFAREAWPEISAALSGAEAQRQ